MGVSSIFKYFSFESSDFGSGSYIGFKTAQRNYGWLQVTWDGATDTYQIYSGAYESDAGVPITAGATAVAPSPRPLLSLALNDKGMITHDRRVKKDAFFFYKANWNPEPMLHITSRRLVSRLQPTTEVKVYSNRPEVELKVNGKSQGVVKPDDLKMACWPAVNLQPGINTIEATTRSNEQALSDSCKWVLEPAAK